MGGGTTGLGQGRGNGLKRQGLKGQGQGQGGDGGPGVRQSVCERFAKLTYACTCRACHCSPHRCQLHPKRASITKHLPSSPPCPHSHPRYRPICPCHPCSSLSLSGNPPCAFDHRQPPSSSCPSPRPHASTSAIKFLPTPTSPMPPPSVLAVCPSHTFHTCRQR